MTVELVTAAFRTLPALAITLLYAAFMWRLLSAGVGDGLPGDAGMAEDGSHNAAVLVQRAGLLTAQVLGLLAIVPAVNPLTPWQSMFIVLVEGAWVTIAVLLARKFVDWLLFPKVPNIALLAEGNLAVGIVEAAAYVGIGAILAGSLTGSTRSPETGLIATVVFYVLGVLFVFGYFWLREWLTPYNLRDELAAGRLSAAADLGGMLLGSCLVVAVACSGDMQDWGSALRAFFATAIVSIVLLHLLRFAVRFTVLDRSVKQVHVEDDIARAALLGLSMVLSGGLVAMITSQVL